VLKSGENSGLSLAFVQVQQKFFPGCHIFLKKLHLALVVPRDWV